MVHGLLDSADWSAQWIGDRLPSVENVSAPCCATPSSCHKVRRAVVYATALGVYELHLNGQRVGDHLLAPEFTDYHARTQYQAYDVTALLQAGDNVIGAMLGDGWYTGGVGLAQALIKKHATFMAIIRDCSRNSKSSWPMERPRAS